MGTILKVSHLTKIFGKKRKAALQMVKEAKSKTEILEKPVVQSVFMMLILRFKKVKSLLSWGYQEAGSQP